VEGAVASSQVARARHVDEIAEALPIRAATLARLFLAHTTFQLSRTEIGVLHALSEHPRRITELAAREGVTQPAITLLVNRLQDRGWVRRTDDPRDRRAVRVRLTPEGRRLYEQLRSEFRALLHEDAATLDDADVATLARAVEILDDLIARLEERQP
jgi:DNA-binding MarR family transcriptional regulator